MPKATDDHTPTPSEPSEFDWPMGDLEPAIYDLRTALAILGHLIDVHADVGQDTWRSVEDDLNDATGVIQQLWRQAWDRQLVEHRAHEAALAALEAKKAAPGSPDDIRAAEVMWNMLRAVSGVVADRCEEAGHPLIGWQREETEEGP
jgi:hypothetical protein